MATRTETAGNGPHLSHGLTPKQEAVALALAAGSTYEEAGRKAGAGVTTIKRWLSENPALPARVRELRVEMTARALGKLIDGMASAADTLGYLSRKAKNEMTRLGAARALLELAVKMRESIELEERIAALESGAAGGPPSGRAA